MATYQVLKWQEIPSMVEAKEAGTTHKEQLSMRFQELIDLIAMKKKLAGTDAYLDEWNKSERAERAGPAIDVARKLAAEFEAQYEAIRADALAKCNKK